MARGVKRKNSEQDPDSTENRALDFQDHKRHAQLCHSVLRASLNKYTAWNELRAGNLHKRLLVRNIIRRIKEASVSSIGNGRRVSKLWPQSTPCQVSWAPLPSCSTRRDTASPAEPTKEPWSVVDTVKIEASKGPCAPFTTSNPCQDAEKAANEGGLLDQLPELFVAATGEFLCRENLQQDDGRDPHLTIADSGPKAAEPSSSPSKDAVANTNQETCPWDALCQEGLLSDSWLADPLLGDVESLSSNYLNGLPVDDLFSDIDTSGFESILDALSSDGESTGGNQSASEMPQPEDHFGASEDYFGEVPAAF